MQRRLQEKERQAAAQHIGLVVKHMLHRQMAAAWRQWRLKVQARQEELNSIHNAMKAIGRAQHRLLAHGWRAWVESVTEVKEEEAQQRVAAHRMGMVCRLMQHKQLAAALRQWMAMVSAKRAQERGVMFLNRVLGHIEHRQLDLLIPTVCNFFS